jgi:hypothetical protein
MEEFQLSRGLANLRIRWEDRLTNLEVPNRNPHIHIPAKPERPKQKAEKAQHFSTYIYFTTITWWNNNVWGIHGHLHGVGVSQWVGWLETM